MKPEVAAVQVAACGFKSVRPKFDNTLQEDVVEVLDAAPVSTKQLRCVALVSLQVNYYVTFPTPMDEIYQTLYWRISRERDKTDARAWLKKRGLLSFLTTYDPKRYDEATFARTLEKLCGPKAAGVLKPMRGMATFKERALGNFDNGKYLTGQLDDETLSCLVNAASASGYSLGFIGNEAYQRVR